MLCFLTNLLKVSHHLLRGTLRDGFRFTPSAKDLNLQVRRLGQAPAQRAPFRPSLESLDSRIVPAVLNTWVGSPQSNSWNLATNWKLQHVPTQAEEAVFDGAVSSRNCAATGLTPAGTLVFQNGYAGSLSITNGTIQLSDGMDLRNGGSTAYISFSSGTLEADGGVSILDDFEFTGSSAFVDIYHGAALESVNTQPCDSYAQFTIGNYNTANSGSFHLGGSGTLFFHNRMGITIASGGSMTINNQGTTRLDDFNQGGWIANYGQLS
jgi:hypothetical protein